MRAENENPPSHYPDVRQAFGLVFILFGITIAVGLGVKLVLAFLPQHVREGGTYQSVLDLLAYTLTCVLTLRVALRRRARASGTDTGQPALKFRKVSAGMLAVICLMTAALGNILDPVMSLFPVPASFEKVMVEAFKPNLATFAAVVLAAPVLEELLCRGIILEGLLKNRRPAVAIVWSAALFAFLHLNPWQGVPAFILGLFLGWVYWKTGSLIPCILVHAVNNLISFVLMARYGPTATTDDLMGPAVQAALLAGSVIVFTAGAWWLARNMRQPAAMTS